MSKIKDSPRKRIFGWGINDTLNGRKKPKTTDDSLLFFNSNIECDDPVNPQNVVQKVQS